MNTQTVTPGVETEETAAALAALSHPTPEADPAEAAAFEAELAQARSVLVLASTVEMHRMDLKAARDKFIAALPVATERQFNIVLAHARDESETPEGNRVNEDFRLDDKQKAQLKEVRKAVEMERSQNKAAYIQPLVNDCEQRLVSLKVRVGTKKTTTTARFVKTHADKKEERTGYLAELRRKLAEAGGQK